MTEIWFLFSDGVEKQAGQEPIAMELKRDADQPTDRLTVRYLLRQPMFDAQPWGVRIVRDGALLFLGVVDTHEIVEEAGMCQEKFVARSMAALLTDSEAMPGVLQMPSLRLMQKLYLEPFGMRIQAQENVLQRGVLTVERGMSCWAVLRAFAESFMLCEPYCTRDGAVCLAERERRALCLSDVRKSAVTYRPSEKISRVAVQNTRTGAYSTVFERLDAPMLRARYLHAQADTSPKEIFAQADQAALQVCLVCGGYVEAEPGDTAELFVPGMGMKRMALEAFRFYGEAGEYETELCFTVLEN